MKPAHPAQPGQKIEIERFGEMGVHMIQRLAQLPRWQLCGSGCGRRLCLGIMTQKMDGQTFQKSIHK
ncbi:hypothetical protein AA0521_2991 [Komagataeibacter intermedius NRIC 0521]|uniref:Uncharacterized protein n=1 Tax=Komagataeibacter intermedius NRIC 0521 TaxID=1307934 RepID=A0ABQ0PP24_9PROT|nr:hypothetical protein AA0521_2991 [Komagataeibacter intermedius NRIC 0521]